MITGKPIVIFDLETTDKDPKKARIVELSATVLDNNLQMTKDTVKYRFKPQTPINPDAARKHGITDLMVYSCPPFAQAAAPLFKFFDGTVVIAYDGEYFDVPVLSNEFDRVGYKWPGNRVTIVDPYKIFCKMESRTLAAAHEFYTGQKFEDGHDAERDVKALLNVLQGQMKRYPELSRMTADELEAFCNNDRRYVDVARKIYLNDGVAYYAFGANKDKPVLSNIKYAEWMVNIGDFQPNTKYVVQQLLDTVR